MNSGAQFNPLRKLPSDQEVIRLDAWDPIHGWLCETGAKERRLAGTGGEYTSKCFPHFIQPCDQELRITTLALPLRQTSGVLRRMSSYNVSCVAHP